MIDLMTLIMVMEAIQLLSVIPDHQY